MPKLTREQVIAIKENADRLLKKMNADEKNEWRKLAYENQNIKGSTEKIIDILNNNKTEEKITVLLKQVKEELGEAVRAVKPDLEPLVKSIAQLQKVTAEGMFNRAAENTNDLLKVLGDIKREIGKDKKNVDRTDEVIKAIKEIKVEGQKIEFPDSIAVSNFPVQKIPNPVTNIDINPLKGIIHTTSATVTTSLTVLPTYGVLANRRSIMVFNNSASTTIYLGGSDVTLSNGFPVLAQTYSPSIDAGVRMVLYGVTSSGTADVRVIEISNSAIGG